MAHAKVITVGLDIGYGVTKAVTSDGALLFPSVAGRARSLGHQAAELTKKYKGDQITDSDGEWFIGELAQKQLTRPGELITLRARTGDDSFSEFRLRMAKAALGKLYPDQRNGDAVQVRIATGLPVKYMSDAAELKALLGQKLRIKTDNTNFVADVIEVMVMPQPYGTIYSQTLTEQGDVNDCHNYTRTGVVDVGTYTVDLAVDDDGEYVSGESDGVEAGVHTAQSHIQELLENTYKQAMPLHIVDEVLKTRCFRDRATGETLDYGKEVERALQPLRDATLNKMSELWKAGALLDVIYVSGGGAELVYADIVSVYKQALLVQNAQIANAQGYLNFALFRQNRR